MKELKIIIFGSWNTDGGVSRHTTPVAEWLMEQRYDIKVFTHYRECTLGYPLDVEDEAFVHRCFTYSGKDIPGRTPFNPELLLKAVEEEGYNIFLAEDLGILPMEGLLEVFPRIKAKAKTILLNHDNKPKPDDSPFWKFDWDVIINFLPEQNGFMEEHYPAEKIHCIEFPAYEKSRGDRMKSCEKLNLPTKRNIILALGEYNMVDFLPAICAMRKNDPSIYLLALVYDEERKIKLEEQIAEMKKTNPDIGYDEIRVENSSWQKRRDYVWTSKIVIFDKGEGVTGRGAILSSTAYQVIGWGIPILARDNLFFSPFNNGELVKYRNDEELTEAVRMLLYDDKTREKIVKNADEFALEHSPEKISKQFIKLFCEL
ncbi:MAG: glycosyltransferase [Spirochaetales bacterium]|nr:glycosyltransferase [Spirochaetales bacterium]